MRKSKPLAVSLVLTECRKSRIFGITEKYPEKNPEYFKQLEEQLRKLIRRANMDEILAIRAEQKELAKLRRESNGAL
jgi:hypothetical protein